MEKTLIGGVTGTGSTAVKCSRHQMAEIMGEITDPSKNGITPVIRLEPLCSLRISLMNVLLLYDRFCKPADFTTPHFSADLPLWVRRQVIPIKSVGDFYTLPSYCSAWPKSCCLHTSDLWAAGFSLQPDLIGEERNMYSP